MQQGPETPGSFHYLKLYILLEFFTKSLAGSQKGNINIQRYSKICIFLFEAIFINSQSKICFTLWAFAYCLLQASSDWRWLGVDGVSAVLRSEIMGMYMEDNLSCPMSRFIVGLHSCPRWMWTASLIHLVNLLLSLERILLFSIEWYGSLVPHLNYLPRTFPFSRTVRLPSPIPHLRWVIAIPTKPAANSIGKNSQGKTNFLLWIDENHF